MKKLIGLTYYTLVLVFNFKTTNHAMKVPYRKMLFLDVILACYERAKPVGKEPVLV